MSFSNFVAALFQLSTLSIIVLVLSISIEAQLSSDHYSYSCPKALEIVNDVVIEAIKNETRMGASLLRIHFHDCFVNGCDASVLLDDNATFTGEKTAFPNNHSLRGFHVVDVIKAQLEKACPNVVSCADILAIVARDAVYHLGGPTWEVKLGRRDSLTANRTAANLFIPAPSSNITVLTSTFADVGLSFEDLVALSGIPQPVLTPDAEEARARLYFLSEELRIFPDVLGDRFKASVIFAASHDRGEEEGDSEEPTTHPQQAALPSLSESVSMSTETSKTRSKPSGLDLLMRKRRSGSTESSPAKKPDVARKSFTRSAAAAVRPITKPPIPATPAAGLDSSIPVAIEDDYDIHLPAGYGTNSSSLFPEMDQLLLPNFSDTLDKRRLGEILDDSCMLNFRALQDSLYLRQGVRTVQRDMVKYKKEAASHKAEADALRKEKEAGDTKLAVLQDQLSRIQGVNVGYIAGLQKAKARIQELKEQSVEVGTYYAWETKIQCLEAYHSGEMATWNLEEERAEFNRVYQDKPEVGVYSDEEGEEETTSPPIVEVAVPSDAQEVQPAAPVEVQPVSNVPVEHEEHEGGEEVVAAEVAVEEFLTELK